MYQRPTIAVFRRNSIRGFRGMVAGWRVGGGWVVEVIDNRCRGKVPGTHLAELWQRACPQGDMPLNAYVATLTRLRVLGVIRVRPKLLGTTDRHHVASFEPGKGLLEARARRSPTAAAAAS